MARVARWAAGRAMGAHEDRSGACGSIIMATACFTSHPTDVSNGLPPAKGCPETASGPGTRAATERSGWASTGAAWLTCVNDDSASLAPSKACLRGGVSVCEDKNGAMWIGTGGEGCAGGATADRALRGGRQCLEQLRLLTVPASDRGLWLSAAESEELYDFNGEQVQRAPGERAASNPFWWIARVGSGWA